jgi:hypothetical protein
MADPRTNGTRPGRHPPADWAATAYRPSPGTALLHCARCGAAYLDDGPSRDAHRTVFGHRPPKTPQRQDDQP